MLNLSGRRNNMVRDGELWRTLARKWVKTGTIMASIICFAGAVITFVLGEEPFWVALLFVVGLLFAILRALAEF